MRESATEVEVVDLAGYGAEFTADPYPVYARLREQGPVHRVRLPDGREPWLVVGYEAVRSVLTDPRVGKDWRAFLDRQGEDGYTPVFQTMLDVDPPHHTRLRKLVTGAFTPGRVEALRPWIEQMTAALLDAMLSAPDRRADLVEALAFPLPMTVICELLGVPDLDRQAFRSWSNEIIAPTGPEAATEAHEQMNAYLVDLVAAKRADGGEDLLSALLRTSDEDGDCLSPAELVGMAFLLLVAGHETTVNLIAGGVRELLTHPEQLAALRADPKLLDGAVEEILRHDGPVETATYRFTSEPVEIGGTVLPAGVEVLVVLASGSRDPERFADADTFDITRDARGHVAFGHGIHFCLGAPLARLEGRVALAALLERCPDLALDEDPAETDWRPGILVRGPRRLPVRW